MITRRSVLVGLGVGSLSTALPAFAQQGAKRPKVGVLWHAGSAEEEKVPLGGLVEGLRDLGYVDGKNIVLEHRFPNEQPERFISLGAELVQMKVDVLIAVTFNAAVAAQKATTTIPIVFIAVPDPLGSKLVASLGRPGGNITGLTNLAVELVPKRMQTRTGTASPTSSGPELAPDRIHPRHGQVDWHAYDLWSKQRRIVQAGGILRRQDSQGHQAGRPACRTADRNRVDREPPDCEGPRADDPAVGAGAGGRDHPTIVDEEAPAGLH